MMKFTHLICHLALSAAYTGASMGFDKTAIYIAAAIIYLLLALDNWHHTKG